MAWLLAAVAFTLATIVNARTSATVDEPNYLAAGVSYWKTGDYRLHPDSPPLAPGLGGIAALTLSPRVPTSASEAPPPGTITFVGAGDTAAVASAIAAWEKADDWAYGDFFFNHENRAIARELGFRARLPIAFAGAALVLIVFFWARSLAGDAGGVGAATLAAFSPTWLAHSAVLSCDVLVSTLMAATVFVAARALSGSSGSLGFLKSATLGVIAFLALSSKFTALALVPILGILAAAIVVLRRRRIEKATLEFPEVVRYFMRATVVAVVLIAAIGYPGRFGLPSYLAGVKAVYRNVDPNDWFFFLGTYSHHGWPLYATTSLLLKATLATLALGVAGGVICLRRRSAEPAALAPVVLLLVTLAGSLADPAAYGVRRVLPAFPALFVLGGVALGAAFDSRKSLRGRLGWSVSMIFLITHVASSLAAFPSELPYMNEVARALGEPTDFFADSNVDWGQALPDLARAIRERKPARVKFQGFGWVDPEIYGVHAEALTGEDLAHPESGVLYAVSATALVQHRRRVRAGELPPQADWLTREKPIARAGEAIYLYTFP